MKAKILLLLLSVLISSCGSRHKKLQKESEKTEMSSDQNFQQSENSEIKGETSVDINKYLNHIGLKITSTGTPYQFQIGDFKFSGNANVDFSNKKEETKFKFVEKIHTTYKSHITYKTHTTYKTQIIYRYADVKTEKPVFWLYVLLYFAGFVTVPLIKYLKK